MINWFQLLFVVFVAGSWVFFGLDLWKKLKKRQDKDELNIFYSMVAFPIVSQPVGYWILLVLSSICIGAVSFSLFELIVSRHEIDIGGFVLLALAPQLAYSVLPINKVTVGSDFFQANGVRFELAHVFVRQSDSFFVFTARGVLGEVVRIPDRYIDPSTLEQIHKRLEASRKAE